MIGPADVGLDSAIVTVPNPAPGRSTYRKSIRWISEPLPGVAST